jgi:Lar family restriction alleviation protein
MEKPKPCPFCGRYAELRIDVTKGLYLCYVMCLTCSASSRYTVNDCEAVESWNKRAVDGLKNDQ